MSAAVAEAPARSQEDATAGAAMRAAAEAQQLRELEDKVHAILHDLGLAFHCVLVFRYSALLLMPVLWLDELGGWELRLLHG